MGKYKINVGDEVLYKNYISEVIGVSIVASDEAPMYFIETKMGGSIMQEWVYGSEIKLEEEIKMGKYKYLDLYSDTVMIREMLDIINEESIKERPNDEKIIKEINYIKGQCDLALKDFTRLETLENITRSIAVTADIMHESLVKGRMVKFDDELNTLTGQLKTLKDELKL